MANLLVDIIKLVEEQWLSVLSAKVKDEFSKVWLPSHDLSHHVRVWGFAKQLLGLHSEFIDLNKEFIEALMIACFFHDTGLTITIDFSHGKEGSNIAADFLRGHPVKSSKYYNEMVEAIVLHDDKSYETNKNNGEIGIYQILTVADDLDALGALGLYRYLEIYNSRGINEMEVMARIENNLQNRYSFISKHLLGFNSELEKHKNRFNEALNYLRNLNINQIRLLNSFLKNKSGHILMLDTLKNNSDNRFLVEFIRDVIRQEAMFE